MTEPLEKKEELIRYFESGAKPRDKWRIGTEYEKVAVSVPSGTALPFSGPGGVEEIMRRLIDRYGYQPDDEHGRIIALRGERAPITIEPGGQIELSGEQCDNVHCALREFSAHAQQLIEIGHQIGAAVLGLGIQPLSRIDEIELLPKARYHIMYPYMARKGRLGQRMMKQTAGVQANLDYADEADAMRKLRLSMGIVPLLYAVFANSPISDGSLNGYQSFRGHIWTDTDRDRCGVPPFVFGDSAGFEDYAEYALDVPMYFLMRDHRYLNLTAGSGITFRQFMEQGWNGHRATLDDWANHLTTLFIEVRLKKYVEVRTADSQSPALMLALPALLKGVLYDDDCLLAAWDLVKRWSYEERVQLTADAHKMGLEARAGRATFKDLGLELLNIAATGLTRQRALNERGEDESIYLLRLIDLVRSGHSPASLLVAHWKGRWNYDIGRLVADTAYDAEAAF
ncbi:MAG: glutamate--cysteine ligase [Candidatus Binataceae bacterium]|nr:glutamate--cysteine ligase [Candidatus Binataceae bacterium]